MEEKRKRIRQRRIEAYFPDSGPLRRALYKKHLAFFEAGATRRERCFMAANRVGKTESAGGYETVLHMTGRYPAWWVGRRFDRPVKAWAAGDTAETVRDILQGKLLGPQGAIGTGLIPADTLVRTTRRTGVSDAVMDIHVRHESGGISQLTFKSYDQGRKKFQGTEIDLVWLDEEPPADIYGECLVRTMTTGGLVMLTFTPLMGVSAVVEGFMKETEGTKALIQAGWDDVPHLDQAAREELKKGLPDHEVEARSQGIPSLGSGRVFPVEEAAVAVPPFVLPDHWPRICGIDFGWDHPTAAVELAWDRDHDALYVTRAYRRAHATPAEHAAALTRWGGWLPWAWPHDGYQHDKGSGRTLRDQYAQAGLNMLDCMATHADGGNGVEAGIMEMLTAMREGRFKVFSNLAEWFGEFRLYHRRQGQIVKLKDDLMSATRYAMMMRREAVTKPRLAKGDLYQAEMQYPPEF
ncbi:phage terminase large subunit-like protein [Aestuariispira insulae]|uniref:Phage terminase large subunit-like protein n=1 Tax=Aestuariispira insulae TaxID=1461337 RepID=A0A3D9HRP0_9PROT|nr:phage terminase large subunit-like protein [Aestuariispira insulae]